MTSGPIDQSRAAPALQALARARVIPLSIVAIDRAVVGLRQVPRGWEIVGWTPQRDGLIEELAATTGELGGGLLLWAPADEATAAVLRRHLDWLRPRPVGLRTAVGLGDRLGIAAPGHIQALRANPGIAPVLAQQSSRELSRTHRRFVDVLTAATFGVMAEGWHDGFGADADHLKSTSEVDAAIAAGFTTITVDPIHLVPDMPADAPRSRIKTAFEAIDWTDLEDDEQSFRERYADHLDTDDRVIPVPTDALTAAAARFAPAVAHLVRAWRHLGSIAPSDAAEFEVAVDETGHQTTAVDHIYLVTELQRLGVRPVAFAPRFVGTFEKGVDYLGDPAELEADIATHASIARRLGPYKVSVHSGSDKFSVYDAVRRSTGGLVHLKTSGTSYLEALRTIAVAEPALFRNVWRIAAEAYAASRSSYHVSARLEDAPDITSIPDAALPNLLDARSVREILHVTYGAVLVGHSPAAGDAQQAAGSEGSPAVIDAVMTHRERYWAGLANHIGRHLAPFSRP